MLYSRELSLSDCIPALPAAAYNVTDTASLGWNATMLNQICNYATTSMGRIGHNNGMPLPRLLFGPADTIV